MIKIPTALLLLVSPLLISSQSTNVEPLTNEIRQDQEHDPEKQLSRFVRRIFEDKNGNLWFGTNGDGVIRYNGKSLDYFSIDEGFGGVAVRGIVGDENGNVWFGTERGLTKYDGKSFTNYNSEDGLVDNDIWCLTFDRKGILWIGTYGGVSKFDGKNFEDFDVPSTKRDPTRGVTSAEIIHCIHQDSQGRMWFATNGGAFYFDGKTLKKISEKDGLCNDVVNCILDDRKGNIWFATHHKGICRWDGKSFTHITKEKHGVKGIEAWDLYQDQAGHIWFPVENFGMYRFNGKSFDNFQKDQGLASSALQCTFQDTKGRIWCGGWKGLFRFDGKSFFSVTKDVPWK